MANELGVNWGLVNLVSEKQFQQRQAKAEYQDPTQFIRVLLPEKSRNQFLFYSWERLYANPVAKSIGMAELAGYMRNKSANCVKAFSL